MATGTHSSAPLVEPPRPLLSPSLLAGNHAHLADSAAAATRLGVQWLHLDIMDGHFVPNLSFGPQTVAALRPDCPLFFDTHLMLSQPQNYIEAFAKAGSDLISIHIEADCDHAATLSRISQLGCRNGIVLNPGTPASAIRPFIDRVDLVLVMTVQPGFGGQSFREDMLPKIAQVAAWRSEQGLRFRIEVDGGIDLQTGKRCRDAGADTFVAGTAFFQAPDRPAFAHQIASW